MNRREAERLLRVISRAWGRKQRGYCFFPWIDREEQAAKGNRRAGYYEGPDERNPAFLWPRDRDKILDHMLAHTHHDLYWCPSLFEYPQRREDVAMDEHALWADLDEVDPSTIDDFPPTIAWETSPGRYQALWVAAAGDFQGASWPGNENQRLTYHIGADRSGWDTTQLLRIPGWENHKLSYKDKHGKSPQGKLLWDRGQSYLPGDFAELPQVAGLQGGEVTDALELEIESVDRFAALARVKLKLTRRTRDLLSARSATGDRSDALWEMERSLADAGCSVAEIVAIVRETVWNKYVDRADETRRLILEASKAIAAKPDTPEQAEEEIEREPAQRLGTLLKNVKKPRFLIDGIWTEGAVGFIAGEPKCYKSWTALDMALSLATGADFLGHFRIIKPGPVLYIQEEDPLPTLKARTGKIWVSKAVDKMELVPSDDGMKINWLPPKAEKEFDPDVNAYVQKGIVISDEAWQLWLDEVIAEGMDGKPYVMVFIDTLMMVAGDVEENRSQVMTTKIFKPLKTLARKHNCAIGVVHHMGKSEKARSGQRMLGAVANHAWSEDSLYLSRAVNGDIKMELESKTVPANVWRISNLNNTGWHPIVGPWSKDDSTPAADDELVAQPRRRSRKASGNKPQVPGSLTELKKQGRPLTTKDIADAIGISRSQVWRQLRKLEEANQVTRHPGQGSVDEWELTQ